MSLDWSWYMERGRLMGQASKRDNYNCPCLMTNGPVLCWQEVVFFLFSACIKRLWGYHSSHHCHHHYQHFHHIVSCPALINMEPLMQPDSTDNIGEAKCTLNRITLTEFIFPRRTFTQLLWNTNRHRAVKIVYTVDH